MVGDLSCALYSQLRYTWKAKSLAVLRPDYLEDGCEALLVAGGRITSRPGDELSSAELLQPGAARWKPIAALPQPRLAPSLVLIAGRPRLSGGHYEVNMGIQLGRNISKELLLL